jgi:hypothetical protein
MEWPMLRWLSPVVVALGLLASPVQAAERALDLLDVPVSYTADFTVSSDKGTYHGTVWHAPGRERRDFGTQGGSQTVLLRRDTDTAYLMKPSQRWYVGLGFQAVGSLAGGIDSLTVNRQKLGEETLGGMRVTRYRVTANGPKGARFDGDAWFTREGIMVRAEGTLDDGQGRASDVATALSGLKVGKVDERMFELPAGWLGMDLRSVPPDRIAQAVEGIMALKGGRQ